MLINATVIVSGKVVEGTHNSTQVTESPISAPCLSDEAIGLVVRRAVDAARKQGYYMGDPNAYVRVEFKD